MNTTRGSEQSESIPDENLPPESARRLLVHRLTANKKLTKIVAGHTLNPPSLTDGKFHFTLDDGSTMDVTPASGFTYPAGKGGKIARVQQDGTDLVFILVEGGSIEIKTADASSSVFMRDKAGGFAYAG